MEQGIGDESGCCRMRVNRRRSIFFLSLGVIFALNPECVPTAKADNAAVTVTVDANLDKHPISPYVYGVALGQPYTYNGSTAQTTSELEDLNSPLNRYGGDDSSTYNWQLDADNHPEYYFESIQESTTPGGLADTFAADTKSTGAEPMITIPMMDYIATLSSQTPPTLLCSFPVSMYPTQDEEDPSGTCGNGQQTTIDADGKNKTTTNLVAQSPPVAYVANSIPIQTDWLQHIVSKFGSAANGGVKFYILDNEYSLWYMTHRDIQPTGAKAAEVIQKMLATSAAIRSVDSTAMIAGPEEAGWYSYLFSGYDQQTGMYTDHNTYQTVFYATTILDQLHQNDVKNGTRSLDVFSLHYYPSPDELHAVAPGTPEDAGNDLVYNSLDLQMLRNQSTRSLWDPNYADSQNFYDPDTGQDNAKVMLIPRMKNWVSTYYPGLKTAITEYNWGAEYDIGGATAQADIFGIFGREGLDYATRYNAPDSSTPTYKAMKMYRNYDGNKSTFGDTSISATVPDSGSLASFASIRSSDGTMTVMVISKVLSDDTPVTVDLANFVAAGTAQVWQLTSANTINQLANVNLTGDSLNLSVPAQSITLLVIPAGTATTGGTSGGTTGGTTFGSTSGSGTTTRSGTGGGGKGSGAFGTGQLLALLTLLIFRTVNERQSAQHKAR